MSLAAVSAPSVIRSVGAKSQGQPPSKSAHSASLDVWMNRVLERAEKVPPKWHPDHVHDLRTALRRCRTMADALQQVNPAPGWHKLKRNSRDLFQATGSLRDTHVKKFRFRKLAPPNDPSRKRMLQLLSLEEKTQRDIAEKELEKFDRKSWRKASRKLSSKARFFPVESVVFQRLALAQLNESVELFQHARRRPSSVAWHRLRIAIKRFRYIVENFLPQRYEVWVDDLKRLQDLLGDVHDLDVLRDAIRHHRAHFSPDSVAAWYEKIKSERKIRLAEFIAITTGSESPWLVWRAGFHWGSTIQAVPMPQRKTA